MADLPEQLVVALSADISKLDKQLQKALGNVANFAQKQESTFKSSFDKVERMAAQVKLQDKLSIAQARGDSPAIKDLQQQLELSKQIQRYRIAGMDQAGAEASARAHMEAMAAAQMAGAVAQREAAREQIALEERLEVARARGERREVEALEEELALSRAIAKYRSVGFGEQQSREMAGAQMAALVGARRQAKSGNIGEAIDKTLEHSRLGVLEEGAARVPIFGSALEALGPAGLTAAAGVLAAAEAMEHAKEAAEYAEELTIAAGKLGVTTKALQEYQYVAIMSGVSTDTMREALEKGNEALGAFQSGVGATRIKPVFEALGISQAEAQKASSITDLLPQIAEKIKAVGSTAEQAKLAEKLGLSDILPVLQRGRDGVEELRAEAVKAGVVLDTELVQRGKEAAEAYKKASAEVDGNLKRAFIELAPLIKICVDLAAELAKQFADAMDSFHGIQSQNRTTVLDEKTNTERGQKVWASLGHGQIDKGGNLQGGGAFETMMFNRGKARLAQLDARLKDLDAQDAKADAATSKPGGKTLVTPKEKKAPEDRTDDLDKTASDARDAAAKELASAQAALTKGFLQHADLEKKAVDADTDKKLADLAAQEQTIRKAKNDAHKVQQLAALEAAKADTQSAATAKKELIDREAMVAFEAKQREIAGQLAGAMADHLDFEAKIAATMAGRRQLELQALALRQETETKALAAQNALDVHDKKLTPEGADALMASLQQRQADQRQDVVVSTNSPGRAFDRQLDLEKGGLGDQLQGVEVAGVEQLGDALDAVITRTKTVSQAFHEMALSIVGDLLKIAIRREVETPLADMLFKPNAAKVTVGTPITSAIGQAAGGAGLDTASVGAATAITALATAASSAALALGGAAGVKSLGALPGGSPSGFPSIASLSMLLPHFAGGTDNAPGGEALVGENGPEEVELPQGSKVIPNSALRQAQNVSTSSIRAPEVRMNHNVTIDLTGANGDATIARVAHAAATEAYAQSVATSRKDLRRSQQSASRSFIG